MTALCITIEEARGLGLRALTTGYRPEETPLLENVMADMRRSDRPWALVPDTRGTVEVWVLPIPAMAVALAQ